MFRQACWRWVGVVSLALWLAASVAAAPVIPASYEVTIRRDAFGVPHSHGATDADAAYGYAWAQAEDNFWQIEENFLRASGRAAEVHGETALLDDRVNHSMRVVALAQDEYAGADSSLRAILDAYAAAVNDWAASTGTAFRALDRVEPWHPLALIRYLYFQRGFLGAARLQGVEYREAFEFLNGEVDGAAADPRDSTRYLALATDPRDDWLAAAADSAVWPDRHGGQGSNSWAVSPARSASGNALLFINPHLPHFGPAQVYEAHLSSDAGWNFTGYGRFGFPMPYVGHNPDLGWASTDNAADLTDVYVEHFVGVGSAPKYRWGQEWLDPDKWSSTVRVRRGDRLDEVELHHLATRHGPVLGHRNDRMLSVRMAKLDGHGWLAQWYAMGKARSLDEFRAAVQPLDMLFGNYLYADRAGNIFYVYNAAIPMREESLDWTLPVDGSDPATDWRGYHSMSELPQLLNPAAGWIQNCNSTPFLSSASDNPLPADFPSYMAREPDTARAMGARAILSSRATFDFEEWTRLSYDTRMAAADELVPRILDAATAASLSTDAEDAVEVLRAWNRRAALDSVATTLFVTWGEQGGLQAGDAMATLAALEMAIEVLQADWGNWRVAWGEINRAQRVHSSGDEPFDDSRPSHPVVGVPSWAGASFTFWSAPREGLGRRYATGGNSYVSVVEFGERVRGRSLMPFGQSADPASPHHLDQIARYANGFYRSAWLYLDDVKAHAAQEYRPGHEPS